MTWALMQIYCEFNSENIFKIGHYFLQLWTNMLPHFYGPRCSLHHAFWIQQRIILATSTWSQVEVPVQVLKIGT